MKKALYIIDTLEIGGAEKSLLQITSKFQSYQPVFIQMFKGGALKSKFEEVGIQVISMDMQPSYNFKSLAKKLIPIVKDINPDLIHTTLFRSDMVGRQIKKIINVPLINSFVNNSYGRNRYVQLNIWAKLKLFVIQLWDRNTCDNVSLFISNSLTIKESNAKALAVTHDRIKVIYRGRNFKEFQKSFNSKKKTEQLGINSEKVFLNVSRLLQRKGQLDLINAFALFIENHPNSRLLIAGEGNFRNVLEDQINKLNVSKYISLLGNRTDINELLNLSDFFVFPSYYEGLPGALIEAMISGIPIIASDIPENLECVNSESAIIFKKGNVEDLKNALEIAVNSDNTDRIKNALKLADYNFNIDRIALEYENTYDSLIS